MGTKRNRKTDGQYALEIPCDCCGKPAGADYLTDDEVCGDSDGPGFYLCNRVRCAPRYEGKPVEERRALFTAGRESANARLRAARAV
jgi:hypothetical protein